jgi:hypothetical protein
LKNFKHALSPLLTPQHLHAGVVIAPVGRVYPVRPHAREVMLVEDIIDAAEDRDKIFVDLEFRRQLESFAK